MSVKVWVGWVRDGPCGGPGVNCGVWKPWGCLNQAGSWEEGTKRDLKPFSLYPFSSGVPNSLSFLEIAQIWVFQEYLLSGSCDRQVEKETGAPSCGSNLAQHFKSKTWQQWCFSISLWTYKSEECVYGMSLTLIHFNGFLCDVKRNGYIKADLKKKKKKELQLLKLKQKLLAAHTVRGRLQGVCSHWNY